jgi:hypothetical protein
VDVEASVVVGEVELELVDAEWTGPAHAADAMATIAIAKPADGTLRADPPIRPKGTAPACHITPHGMCRSFAPRQPGDHPVTTVPSSCGRCGLAWPSGWPLNLGILR